MGDKRARGALYGLAIGDALGMPTQLLTRVEVIERWGLVLSGFEPAPPGHPIADGMPAGAVTDDTEQAVLLARALVAGRGEVDPHAWASALAGWERDMAARGSLDLLGPSTRRAVAAILDGVPPSEAGLHGDTNGAAMRIAPVGIAFPPGPALLAHVWQASMVTHNTPVALSGAAAVAAAVSAGIDGASVPEAIAAAVEAARALDSDPGSRLPDGADPAGLGAMAPPGARDSIVASRIEWVVDEVRDATAEEAADFIVEWAGTSLATHESVPAAFAVLAAVPGDPWQACLLAASLGGDSDTIAAMAGAIAGACHGVSAFPPAAVAQMDANGLDLASLADALLALRSRP
ncbi:MAG TPA: ADP-ribosylglycohydrolase family protein [Trebonia sp.]|nr:ADP-ribosylglycohydrolase family protein [Trebonia sp.]